MPSLPVKLYLGDVVELKKPHPCGSNAWEIVRLGAYIRLRCQGCNRYVLLPRERVERRLRRFLARPQAPSASPGEERT
jgi:hypothetical protein